MQSQSEERLGDYKLKQWKEAGLPKRSKLRMKFAILDNSLVIKRLGKLTDEDTIKIRSSLIEFFGIE